MFLSYTLQISRKKADSNANVIYEPTCIKKWKNEYCCVSDMTKTDNHHKAITEILSKISDTSYHVDMYMYCTYNNKAIRYVLMLDGFGCCKIQHHTH